MKKVEITYVASFEITKTVEVPENNYEEILDGSLPDDLEEELCNLAMTKGIGGFNWSAKDEDGKEIVLWG